MPCAKMICEMQNKNLTNVIGFLLQMRGEFYVWH